MLIVERTTQLSDCLSLIAETTTRQGQVVLIEGLMATGRTELLRSVRDGARDADFCVLSATCSPAESALPFGVLSQLWHSASLPSSAGERAARLLADGVVGARRATEAPTGAELAQVHHGLALALLDLAMETPVLVTVDDLRHADAASLQCLLNVIRRSTSSRIMIVLTDDVADHSAQLCFRAELLQQPHVSRMRIAPLSPAGVSELVTHRFGPMAAARLATQWHTLSGGNPLLLKALLEDYTNGDGPTVGGYGLATASCLRRRDPIVTDAVRGLAVLGDEAGDEEVAELIGVNAELVRRTLDSLDAAGILDSGRLRHETARTAVLSGLTPAERAGLDRKAAELLHNRGASATRVARHLVAANDVTAAWAAPVLVEAADLAQLDHDGEAAARFLETALELTTGERERAAILAKLADAEWSVNPGAAARHLDRLIAAARDSTLDRSRWPVLLRQLLWHSRNQDAADLMRLLRADPGPAEGAVRDLDAWLAYTHPTLVRRRTSATTGPQPADASNTDPWLRSTAVLAGALARGQDDETVARAEDVLRDLRLSRDTAWTDEAVLLALLAFVYADRNDKAVEWHDRLLADLAGRPDVVRRALLATVRAEIAVRDGDLAAGLRHATTALRHLPARSWGVAVGLPLGSLILAATRMGRYEEAAKYLTYSIPEGMFTSRYGLGYLWARGQYHLATNHAHAALADFRSCGELMRDWGLDIAGLAPWRTSAAEAWLRLGNSDQARLLIFDQLARPGVDGTRIRGTGLWLLALASPPSRRMSLCTEALELLERSGDRFGQARVLADLGQACNAAQQKRRARLLLRQALHVANMCGAQPLATELFAVSGEAAEDTVSPDLRPAGIEPGGRIGSLSSSERRVASLAVMGYTNREIAARLYVTPSTVEQHLTRVYRKLDVKRRKDLPVDLRTELTKTG